MKRRATLVVIDPDFILWSNAVHKGLKAFCGGTPKVGPYRDLHPAARSESRERRYEMANTRALGRRDCSPELIICSVVKVFAQEVPQAR